MGPVDGGQDGGDYPKMVSRAGLEGRRLGCDIFGVPQA